MAQYLFVLVDFLAQVQDFVDHGIYSEISPVAASKRLFVWLVADGWC
jgi:hypothetical protein